MSSLSVNVDIDPDEDLFGYTVDDLQEDILVTNKAIHGTLKFINDYSAAGFVGDESSGNFIALHCEVPNVEGATITVEVVNGRHGPTTLDDDGLVVVRIADKSSQKIKVVASKEGYDSITKIFALDQLEVEDS